MLLQPTSWLSCGEARHGHIRLRASAAHAEWNHVGIALVAMSEGYFAAEGLPEVELISFPQDESALVDREEIQVDLVARGVVDIAIDPRATFALEASNQGKPVCIVAARRKTHAFAVIAQPGITSVDDLKGMTVDMGQPGGATDIMLREFLKDSGLEPDRDVKFEYSGGAMHDSRGQAEAFRSGRRGPVAMTSTKSETARYEADGYVLLADLGLLYPSRHDRVTAANEDFVREQPEALKAFLKAMIRGCNFVLDPNNRPRFEAIIREGGFLANERERRNYDGLYESWNTRVSRDLTLPQEGIDRIVTEERRAGKLPPSFDVANVLRLDALHKAQLELGLAE
jgi:ABC-type nitrate/sulfonate/bicarbonate transport system substrate-binding protein